MTDKQFKRILLWVAVVFVLAASVWGLTKIAKTPKTPSPGGGGETAAIIGPITEQDQTIGQKTAKVVLMEYSDFQCPACAIYNLVVKQVVQEYKDRIEFVYRHFPLPQHANAKPAAYAAEAAGKQEKFWEMTDVLFLKQSQWENQTNSKDIFAAYAEGMGLNVEQFKKDFDSAEIKNKVEKDWQSAMAANLDHTPTFILNNKEIPNPQSYEEFKNILEQAIQ